MTYCLRYFMENFRYFGPRQSVRTLAWNLRFELGYRIGGFTRATRSR